MIGYLKETVLLYSKSDKVPAHWPHRTLGPIHHVSPYPYEFKGETSKEHTNTTLGEHPGELASQVCPNQLRLDELKYGDLTSSSPTASSSLGSSLEQGELTPSLRPRFRSSMSFPVVNSSYLILVYSPLCSLPLLWLDNIMTLELLPHWSDTMG